MNVIDNLNYFLKTSLHSFTPVDSLTKREYRDNVVNQMISYDKVLVRRGVCTNTGHCPETSKDANG
jgi:hypothetical protein